MKPLKKRGKLSPDAEGVLRTAAASPAWVQAAHAPSPTRGEAVKPAKGDKTNTKTLHPQPADAAIHIRGRPDTLALVIELAERLGLEVSPSKVTNPTRWDP